MVVPRTRTPSTSSPVVGHGQRHLSPELKNLLHTGPFDVALRAAIRTSRLSLERIQHRLHLRGTPVSITALSYWQSGRRRPERPDSLAALRELEDVLGIPGGALSALLGPPKPRGRSRAESSAPPLTSIWSDNASAAGMLSRLDTSADAHLTRLSQHDVLDIDGAGKQRGLHVRQLVQAERNGVDRWVTVFDNSGTNVAPPAIRTLNGCHLGQVLSDHENGVVVAELLFERALEKGETALLEYEIAHGPEGLVGTDQDHTYSRRFRLPVREYLVELRFDPENPPARCENFTVCSDGSEREAPSSMSLDSRGRTHAVALDFGRGSFCVRWEPARSTATIPAARLPHALDEEDPGGHARRFR
ncbi:MULTISPECIES: hypothetical protein [Actinopolyspora]|uniref:Uncharacterized protein n=1 Tax=Actinopolyspora saharensis TaxID=995062 RepID=A0A1H0Y4I2_9ACTN|nr:MULTISPECIES: hypothetical protein [Actinopolyspora]NHD17518.1 hypothetical protein [Actinopolyspora sp. BKK2]NHE76749.1 hypothetical protein [Actinopolyspora sp. BKK1]SDQ09981.1 hypothetical protein SAMN04489718_0214 [Actinopolyspora saharensis]